MSTVKRNKATDNVKLTITEFLMLQNTDRSRADVRKWWTALQNAEQINYPNRSRLYDLYERAVMDGHLTGVMEKRIASLLNKVVHFEDNGKRIDAMEDFIQSGKFQECRRRFFERKSHGLCGLEFKIGESFDFVPIPRKHIKPEVGVIAIEQNQQDGIPYKELWNVLVLEDVERFGFLLKCVPYTIWKTGSLADLAQYIELYGQPIRKAIYDGDDPETKSELKTALKESGGSFTIMMPRGAELEIIGDHVTNGTGEVHKVMFSQCNNEISIIVLGNTETTSNDQGGSNAKAQEHGKQQLEITKNDMREELDWMNSKEFKAILRSYNLPVSDTGKFVHEKEIDLIALGKKKDIDLAISAKVPIADDYYYETYGIPKPDNYDELRAKMDEERAAKLNPPNNGNNTPHSPGKKNKKPNANEANKLSAWDRLRSNMADFFDLAPKD